MCIVHYIEEVNRSNGEPHIHTQIDIDSATVQDTPHKYTTRCAFCTHIEAMENHTHTDRHRQEIDSTTVQDTPHNHTVRCALCTHVEAVENHTHTDTDTDKTLIVPLLFKMHLTITQLDVQCAHTLGNAQLFATLLSIIALFH